MKWISLCGTEGKGGTRSREDGFIEFIVRTRADDGMAVLDRPQCPLSGHHSHPPRPNLRHAAMTPAGHPQFKLRGRPIRASVFEHGSMSVDVYRLLSSCHSSSLFCSALLLGLLDTASRFDRSGKRRGSPWCAISSKPVIAHTLMLFSQSRCTPPTATSKYLFTPHHALSTQCSTLTPLPPCLGRDILRSSTQGSRGAPPFLRLPSFPFSNIPSLSPCI